MPAPGRVALSLMVPGDGSRQPTLGAPHDVLDDRALRPCVVIHVGELLADEPARGRLVERPVIGILAQPVTEYQVSALVVRARLPDMEIGASKLVLGSASESGAVLQCLDAFSFEVLDSRAATGHDQEQCEHRA